jgi:ABC-type dipeptide/oligopeptide/nickel transport system permease component
VSLPTFFTGLLLAYVFYFLLGWAPAPLGRLDPMFSPPPSVTGLYLVDALLVGDLALWWACCKQLVLPTVTMALFVLAPIARMTRASMLQVLSSDFVRTARASGLSTTTVRIRYALRNALLPVVTTLGMVFGFMLGSSVIVEKVFGWPGVGSYAIDALTASDYAPVQGFVLAMGVLFVLLNLAVDLLYTLIDPRMGPGGALIPSSRAPARPRPPRAVGEPGHAAGGGAVRPVRAAGAGRGRGSCPTTRWPATPRWR